MRTNKNIQSLLDLIEMKTQRTINFDKEPIFKELSQSVDQSLMIKLLSVFGGFIATLAFIVFLFFTGLYESQLALIICGGIFIIAALMVQKKFDTILIDTICVSAYLMGFILLGVGMSIGSLNDKLVLSILVVISSISFFLIKNYMLSFVSILVVNGTILALIISNNAYDWIHFFVALLAVILTYLFLKEAKILTLRNWMSRIYNPFRIGIIFSFIAGLFMISKSGILPISHRYVWITSMIIIAATVYLLFKVCKFLNITRKKEQFMVYCIGAFLLFPTALYPLIPGSIFLILLGFLNNYKTGTAFLI